MSDGGGEVGRVHEQPCISKKSGGGEDFAQAIAKIAVGQICKSEGFQTFQQSALETLSDIAIQYIHNLGKTSHVYTNFSGRKECNAFDIIRGLEDLGSTQGYSGASDNEHCLADSGTIREIARYVVKADQIPFAYSIPKFPIVKDRKLVPSFSQLGEDPPEKHIPAWLPAFPDSLSYIESRVTELHMTRIEQEKQKKAERPLFNLQQWLASKGIEESFSAEPIDSIESKQQSECNPFLAAPLQIEEKEVSPVVLPTKLLDKPSLENHVMENHLKDSHISVWETFAPAIESMKNNHHNSEEKALLSSRSTVRFKIGKGRKSLGRMIYFRTMNEGFEDVSSWLTSKSGNNDKKTRAGKILKESMESSQEPL